MDYVSELMALGMAGPLAQLVGSQSGGGSAAPIGFINPLLYGVAAGGDVTSAWQECFSDCSATGLPCWMPAGSFTISKQLIIDGFSTFGVGQACEFRPTSIGSGTACIRVQATNPPQGDPEITISGFSINGPGSRSLGVKTANVDGLEIYGAARPKVVGLLIQNCDVGCHLNCTSGNLTFENNHFTNNYYNIYQTQSGNNVNFSGTNGLEGATFAAIGTAYNYALFEWTFLGQVHLGFSPYGIYQEGIAQTGTNGFMNQCYLGPGVIFEAMGNAAVYSELSGAGGLNDGGFGFNQFWNCGFSFNSTYKIAARDQNYAVVVPYWRCANLFVDFISPFTPGAVGTFNIKNGDISANSIGTFVGQVAYWTIGPGPLINGTAIYYSIQNGFDDPHFSDTAGNLYIKPNQNSSGAASVINMTIQPHGSGSILGIINDVSPDGWSVQTNTGGVQFSATGASAAISTTIQPKGSSAFYLNEQTSNKTWFSVSGDALAANYLALSAVHAGNPILLEPIGTDANIDLYVQGKGTGLGKTGGYAQGTVSAGSVTLNAQRCRISVAVTTLAQSETTFTLSNNLIVASSNLSLTLDKGSCTTPGAVLSHDSTGSGSVVIHIWNSNTTTALNGSLNIEVVVDSNGG